MSHIMKQGQWKKTLLVSGMVALGLALTATAVAKSSPEEKAIEYRQGAFKMIGHHFGAMAGMLKGKVEFDAEAFKKNAEAVATLSQFPANGFVEGSYDGKTRAKKKIAENMDDFNKKLETFQIEAANLAEAADGASDLDALKPSFGKVGQSCKACHKAYRNKK